MSVKSNNLLIFLAFLQRKPSWPFLTDFPPFSYRGGGESNLGVMQQKVTVTVISENINVTERVGLKFNLF